MAVIKITTFGGEVPSLSARALPADKARISYNLYPGVDEFRPLLENKEVAVLGVSNPLSLFRLERKADGTLNDDPTNGWMPVKDPITGLTYTGLLSFAKGQINDDLTGRTYYSFDNGSSAPRVMDAGVSPARDGLLETAAVDKPLGIPAPSKPSVAAIYGEEFTPDEYLELVSVKSAEIAAAVRSNVRFAFIGYDIAGAGTAGYINKTISGTVGTGSTTGSTTTLVTNPSNPGGALIPSTSTTGGTATVVEDGFVIGGTVQGSPVLPTVELENVVLTDDHRVGWSMVGLVASIPVAGGGQTGFVPLYSYRTFTWKAPASASAFTYDRVQFEAWFRLNPIYE